MIISWLESPSLYVLETWKIWNKKCNWPLNVAPKASEQLYRSIASSVFTASTSRTCHSCFISTWKINNDNNLNSSKREVALFFFFSMMLLTSYRLTLFWQEISTHRVLCYIAEIFTFFTFLFVCFHLVFLQFKTFICSLQHKCPV